jgi:single stranded DNA-binding protein
MDTKNMVVLTGRVVAEPDLRFTPEGKPVANFSLAVNRSFKGQDGKWNDKLDGFFDCEIFAGVAEQFVVEFKKGALIQVTGTLAQDTYTVGTEPNTRKVSKILVKVKTVGRVLIAPRKVQATAEETAPAEANGQPVPQPA